MSDRILSRRDLLRAAAVSPLWLPVAQEFFATDAFGQNRAKPRAALRALNRYPRMVHEWFVKQVREAERIGLERKNALKTKADAEEFVKETRESILKAFGPLPKKTPLKPRVTRVIKRDAYRIENIIFESRPGFLVTGNLYVPTGRKGPLPAVVGTCGHSNNGKAAGAYQSFAQGLARQGYVVLVYDPIGQGERSQYVDEKLKDRIRVGTRQHLHGGNQQFLIGEFLGTWRAWDGIRALDYLLTRKEVDPKRIGVTGNSGGGTMTTWLCGLEQRWSMAAPSCFVTTFRRNLENELPADTEQCPPLALALGLDHDDFIAAMAPKPVILLAKEKDFFDVRGTREAYARLKRLYKLLGAEKNIGLFVGPTYHGYSQENREAMYRWFNKATGISKAKKEPKLKLEKDEILWCTPHGQVAELKSKTVFDFTRQTARDMQKTRKGPKEKARLQKELRGEICESLALRTVMVAVSNDGAVFVNGKRMGRFSNAINARDMKDLMLEIAAARSVADGDIFIELERPSPSNTFASGLAIQIVLAIRKHGLGDVEFERRPIGTKPVTVESYRVIRHRGRSRKFPSKYHITYAVETEPGVQAIVYRLSEERLYSRPPRGKKRAVLYVSHHSADDELRNEPLIKSVRSDESGVPFFTLDVRGIGESRPGTAGADPYTNPYGADYFYAIHSLMLDRPCVGQKTHDVLRVLDWMRSIGHTDVHLVANGWGTIPATFAAVLSNQITQVTLKNALTSFHDIATTEFYDWPLSSFVPGVLKSFDLPDCYAELKTKKLKQIEPRGAKKT